MTFWVNLARAALALLVTISLSGCFPSAQARLDEEKEPHFLAGKSRLNRMDYQGAGESFEKALEVNPGSASAHFQLACLSEQLEPDPAAAIYHYERYLKLCPNPENKQLVNTRILACKQELARTVSLGPINQTLQTELERLRQANQQLSEQAQNWRTYALHLQTLTNASSGPIRTTQPSSLPQRQQPASSVQSEIVRLTRTNVAPTRVFAMGGHTHVVKPGDTPSVIARKYGLKVTTLMAANPRLDDRRLRVGQTLNLPVQ